VLRGESLRSFERKPKKVKRKHATAYAGYYRTPVGGLYFKYGHPSYRTGHGPMRRGRGQYFVYFRKERKLLNILRSYPHVEYRTDRKARDFYRRIYCHLLPILCSRLTHPLDRADLEDLEWSYYCILSRVCIARGELPVNRLAYQRRSKSSHERILEWEASREYVL